MQEKGNLSINSENFLPIIKKWLYTDKDIFIRELVSNACDAVTKLQKLSLLGEAELAEDETFSIRVVLNQDEKTLQVIDNGIGMTSASTMQQERALSYFEEVVEALELGERDHLPLSGHSPSPVPR